MLGILENIIGQRHLINEKGPLFRMLKNKNFYSFILYGKSGIGKTTLATEFIKKSGITSVNLNGAKSTKAEYSEILKMNESEQVIILIDEIHRLDKTKQNLLLPYLEKKNIIVIGTTTEDVHFNLLPPIISRMLIFNLKDLDKKELFEYLQIINEKKFSHNILDPKILNQIIEKADHDIRKINQYFNFLVQNYTNEELLSDTEIINNLLVSNKYYHSDGKEHYNYVSAFQKSIRASDVEASIYYLAKLLNMGDYEGLLRRLIVIAYEDIGLANPKLVYNVNNIIKAFEKVGMPEGRIILGDYVVELALSPKSKLGYNAINQALNLVMKNPNTEIPKHIQISQDKLYEYSPEKTFFTNNLPKNIKEKIINFDPKTKYEKYLYDRYKYLEKIKQGGKGYDR